MGQFEDNVHILLDATVQRQVIVIIVYLERVLLPGKNALAVRRGHVSATQVRI